MGSVVKNCLCCGKDISNRREAAKYCSARCRELAWRQKHQTVSNVAVCIYNEGVNCEDRQCSRCGWNPAVDAVEVVRCKDCKHCKLCYPEKQIGKEPTPGWYCKEHKSYRKPDDFCSYGERREGE